MKPQCSGTQISLLARPTRARHRATEVPRQATQEFPASLLPGKNTPLSIAGTCKWHSRIAPSRHSRTFARCPSLALRLSSGFYEHFHEENPRMFRFDKHTHRLITQKGGRRARRYISVARIHASPLSFFSRTSAAAFIRYAFEFPGRRFNLRARRSKCASIDGISTPGLRRHGHGVALRLKRTGIPTHYCIYSWVTTYVPSLAHLARAK